MTDKIELISVDILDQHPAVYHALKAMNHSLALSSGWHYALDWLWVIAHLGDVTGARILDAGAGIGLLQWHLADRGAHVLSVDRSDRSCVPFHLLRRFNVSGLLPKDTPLSFEELAALRTNKAGWANRLKALVRGGVGEIRSHNRRRAPVSGSVRLHRGDLRALTDIADESVDAVVSISALEHNETLDSIAVILQELERVLKPGGRLLVTLPAASEQDWFFQPAYSWCFAESTLRELFGLSPDAPSNYQHYDPLFGKLRQSRELRRNISWRYLFTPGSGMPWGKWNPRYQPVGVLKTKH